MTAPTTLAVRAETIPNELTLLPQWVNWNWEQRDDQNGVAKWTKPPRNAATGTRADVSDQSSWATFAAALTASTRADGVGFVLTADDCYVGIDLDNCIDPQGYVETWAQAIVDRFKSYTEFSPSGTGIRIMLRGVLPDGRKQKGGLGRTQTGKLECYDHARFVTLTGHVLSGFETIKSTQAELTRWHAETLGAELKTDAKRDPLKRAERTQDERTLLTRARTAHGFDALYSGDLSAYGGDHSSADQAACNRLANVGATAEQIDALMRSSGLMREKWDRTDYRELTIGKAFDRSPNVSTTRRTNAPQEGGETSCATQLAALMRECDELKRALTGAQTRIQKQERDLDQLRTLQSDTINILSNKAMGQARITLLFLTYDLAHLESAGEPGDDGLYATSRARIADRAGFSPKTITSHMKKIKQCTPILHKVVTLPESVDPTTGEIVPLRRETRIGSLGGAANFAHAAATAKPDKASNWGGVRPKCPRCGSEQTVTITSCAACGLVLATSPKSQDDTSIDVTHRGERRETPKSHLDTLRQSLVSRAEQTTPRPAQSVVFQAEKRAPALSRPPLSVGVVGAPGDDQWTR